MTSLTDKIQQWQTLDDARQRAENGEWKKIHHVRAELDFANESAAMFQALKQLHALAVKQNETFRRIKMHQYKTGHSLRPADDFLCYREKDVGPMIDEALSMAKEVL